MADLANIDISGLDNRMAEASVVVACDVNNPLCGPRGASAIFGPQKGATSDDVRELDAALANYAEVIAKDLDTDVAEIPGSGASGGLGAGLMGFFDARLRLGADIVMDAVNIDEHLKDADLVIVGEGQQVTGCGGTEGQAERYAGDRCCRFVGRWLQGGPRARYRCRVQSGQSTYVAQSGDGRHKAPGLHRDRGGVPGNMARCPG